MSTTIIPRSALPDEGVPFSDSTLRRKERAGLFPKRVRLGPRHHGYLLDQVRAWRAAIVAEHEAMLARKKRDAGGDPIGSAGVQP